MALTMSWGRRVTVTSPKPASQLLETTATPIDDVAGEVGYAEPASFRRLFRMVGIAPSA